MSGITAKIVDFVAETEYKDLPETVIDQSKRVILDAIGCGIAGLATDKGKMAVKLANLLGGPNESSILGTGYRVASANSAFANGELISALDYDATAMGHLSPQLIPAPLALGQKIGASGKDLILAVALGHEIAIRMQSCLPNILEVLKEGPDRGKAILSPVYGYGHALIGGAAGAGKILKLDREKLSYAVGIAGYITPVPCGGKYHHVTPGITTKYAVTGWTCQGEITAVLLASMGYRGDPEVLDGEYGFGRFYLPNKKWNPEKLLDRLGTEWVIQSLTYKYYPCCTHTHTALDCFATILEKNNLKPEEIDHVTMYLVPGADTPNRKIKTIANQIDTQFSLFYPFAALANRVKFIDWQDRDTIQSPNILKFMERVSYEPYPNWGFIAMENPGSLPAAVEVIARGKKFREDRLYRKGSGKALEKMDHENSQLQEACATEEELVRKFKANVSRALIWDKIDPAVECLLNLERLTEINKLIELVTL